MKNLLLIIVGVAMLIASCNDKGSEFDPCEDFYIQNADQYNAECGGCKPGGHYLAYNGDCFEVLLTGANYFILESPLHKDEMLLEIRTPRIRVIDSLFAGFTRIVDFPDGTAGAYTIDALTYISDYPSGIGSMQIYFKDNISSLDFGSDEIEVELTYDTDGAGGVDTTIVGRMYRTYPTRE
jgi:hypothetical protein